MHSDIRYAQSGDVSVAYRVVGEGTVDLLFVHGFVGHLELLLDLPEYRSMLERFAVSARVITFDRRGTGLSDRVRDVPTLEARMDDVRAVLDAVGSRRPVILATFEAAAMAVLFAATYPERVAGLVLYNPAVRGSWALDYPWEPTADQWRETLEDTAARWGSFGYAQDHARDAAPSRASDDDFVRAIARMQRSGASPGAAQAILRMYMGVDVRDVLPAVHVPTLVLSSPSFEESGLYTTDRIPGARHHLVEGDTLIYLHGEELHGPVEVFVTSAAGDRVPDTVLATILFTDIVGSTAMASDLGDAAWAELLRRHHSIVRRQLDHFRGVELDTAGDGFFAMFDGPIRALTCARAITDAVRSLGIEVRAGVHTGECERVGAKLGGLAVAIGARIAARARGGEVLVSSTVKDLVVGSKLEFEPRGEHELDGVPGMWKLYLLAG